MKDITQSRVASALMIGVGAWLVGSIFFLDGSNAALINTLIVGGIVGAAGLAQLLWRSTIPSWVAAATALWLLVSTFIFSASVGFVWSLVASAVAAFALAVWDGIEVSHVQYNIHHPAV